MPRRAKKHLVLGPALPNIPWEDRPQGYADPVWRYSANPIIPRDLIPSSNSIFNSAVVPFKGGFAGVFRCDDRRRRQRLHTGRSDDGINWQLEHEPHPLRRRPEIAASPTATTRASAGSRTATTSPWCNGYHGPTIGVAWTKDFQTFHQIENAFLPFNRNGVLFPRKIDGKYAHAQPPQRQRPHALRRHLPTARART